MVRRQAMAEVQLGERRGFLLLLPSADFFKPQVKGLLNTTATGLNSGFSPPPNETLESITSAAKLRH